MNDFYEKLRYSLGEQQTFDCNILKSHIPNCIEIKKTDTATDKTGIDYIAVLDGGAKIYIDAKTRTPGCSRYWHGEPELAIEMWSVVEKKKVGWTFSKKTNVDYILYTFPKEDYSGYFFIPFQLLRSAAKHCYPEWKKRYPKYYQQNNGYTSQAMFIPASVLIAEVQREMIGDKINFNNEQENYYEQENNKRM